MPRERVVVTGVHLPEGGPATPGGDRPPLALGMVMAYARKVLAGDEAFDLEPRFVRSEEEAERVLATPGRHVLLYSDYIWSDDANRALSRHAKATRPDVINVHGGANVPGYPGACEEYLRRETHVDFAVRGEGEVALSLLLRAIADGTEAETVLPNVSALVDGRFVQHPSRERTRDLAELPSPYLTGVFAPLDASRFVSATIETNRGCPYGCTFCDWGAAINQRVRNFDLDRVRAEIEWIAERKLPGMWIADANFGILERDVEVAQILAETKQRTGFPKRLSVQYAKNTHKHLVEIIEIFMRSGLISTGTISVQTRDPTTLSIVKRTNIKTREYDKLRSEFQKRGLPMSTQLMIALPGATLVSFENDLRAYFDEPIETQVFPTIMLVNSPMAEPSYRAAHDIRWRDDGLVTSTSTMSEADVAMAKSVARVFNAAHVFGILRYVLRYLEWDQGLDPIDLMHALATDAALERTHPLLWRVLDAGGNDVDLSHTHERMREDLRRERLWGALHAELVSWLGARHPVVLGPGLDCAVTVQTAVMPAAGRVFPDSVALPYDFARWYEERRAGRGGALGTYGPGTLTIEDPLGFSGRTHKIMRATRLQWELASSLSVARTGGEATSPEAPRVGPAVALPWPMASADPDAR